MYVVKTTKTYQQQIIINNMMDDQFITSFHQTVTLVKHLKTRPFCPWCIKRLTPTFVDSKSSIIILISRVWRVAGLDEIHMNVQRAVALNILQIKWQQGNQARTLQVTVTVPHMHIETHYRVQFPPDGLPWTVYSTCDLSVLKYTYWAVLNNSTWLGWVLTEPVSVTFIV